MPTPPTAHGAIWIIEARISAAALTLQALTVSLELAEGALGPIQVVIVDSTGDRAVRDLMGSVSGAEVLSLPGARRADAVGAALAVMTAGTVWVGASDACPRASAVLTMLAAASAQDALVLASPDDPAPYAAAPSEVWRAAARPAAGSDVDVVPFVRDWAAAHARVVVVEDAGVMKHRIRQARNMGAQIHASAQSFGVGPATYTSGSTTVAVYEPLSSIDIGGYCSIASDVRIINFGGDFYAEDGSVHPMVTRGMHRSESPTTFPLGTLVPEEPYPEPPEGARGERLVIGDDVWIGFGAKVLGGVTVGAGAVIGAGALVIRDVEAYAVVAGVPAKVLYHRFDESTRRRLLRIEWWDWPEDVVRGAITWFRRTTPEFVEHFDPAGGLRA